MLLIRPIISLDCLLNKDLGQFRTHRCLIQGPVIGAMTLTIMTLSRITSSMPIRLLIVNATLRVTLYLGCAECHNGKCIYALCHFAECHGTLSLVKVLIKKITNIFLQISHGAQGLF